MRSIRMLISSVAKPQTFIVFLLAAVAVAWIPVGQAQDDDLDFLFGPDTSDSDDGDVEEEDFSSEDSAADNEPQGSAASESSTTPASSPTNDQQEDTYAAVPVETEAQESLNEEPARRPDTGGNFVEEIVVTSRKRAESIQDIPLSVTPFSATEMEQRGFTGLDDIAAATPGFTFEGFATGGAHGNAVIRGQAQQFTTARIQNVSFFLDGVYLQRQSMLNLGLIDMERVEVVKGPQNALYGRNAFSGAVNYLTLKPSEEALGYLSYGFGDSARQELRLSMSGPVNMPFLEEGTLFGKFTYGQTAYDGHTRNNHPVANADPSGPNLEGKLGGWDDVAYSAAFMFRPTDNLEFRATYYRSDIAREAAPSFSISGVRAARFNLRFNDQNDLNCNEITVGNVGNPGSSHTGFSAFCGELPKFASDVAERRVDGIVVDPRALGTAATTDAVTFVTQYDITDNLSAHYLFGMADHSSFTDGGASDEDPIAGRGLLLHVDAVGPGGPVATNDQQVEGYEFTNTASSRPNSILNTFSHELRFDWEVLPSLRTSFGAYYSVTEDEEWTELYFNDLCNADTPQNIANCNQPLQAPNTFAERTTLTSGILYDQITREHGGTLRGEHTQFKDEIQAAFASFTYNFSDALEGTIESRYSIEKKNVRRLTDFFFLAPGQTVTYNQPDDPVLPVGNSLTSEIVVPVDSGTFRYFTPRGILNWNYTDSNMVYFSAAKGLKAGGFNNSNAPDEQTYDIAENWTYEIGSKNSFLFRSITVNGAIFFVDWEGLQGGLPPASGGANASDIITNLGSATSLGVELETNFRFRNGFSIDLSGTYNDAQYGDEVVFSAGIQGRSISCDGVVCPADGNVGGNQLARSSKVQASLGVNYRTDILGWLTNARIDTNYQSRQFLTPLNLAWVPERLLTNASIGTSAPGDDWDINLWVKNITDEDYPSNSFVIGVFNQYLVGKGAGRTFGGTLKYNF